MSSTSAQEMLTALFEGGMGEQQLAEAIGVSQPTINRIRTGIHAEPKLSTFQAISALYLQKQAEAARPTSGEGGHAAP